MRKPCLLLMAALWAGTSVYAQSTRLSEQAGNVVQTHAIPGGYAFQLDNGYATITAYSPTIIRVRVTKETPKTDFSYAIDDLTPHRSWIKAENDALTTDSLTIKITKTPFRVSFQDKKGNFLSGDDPALGISWEGPQVTSYRQMAPGEKFIGWGEKTGPLDRRGQSFVNWNTDAYGYAEDKDPIYGSIPFFIGVHDKVCYGIFFDNTRKVFANFGGGVDDDRYYFGAPDGDMNYYFFGASTVPGIIADYTSLTGRTPMPPLWSLGYQQCRWGYMTEQELLQTAKTFRIKQIPADVIYLDIQYMDHYKVFTWNQERFPHPKEMIDSLKNMGFDVVTIIDPGVKIETGYKAYEEGTAKGFFARYPGGKPYIGTVWPGRCNFPDFTRAEVRAWWGDNFKASHTDNGIRGFWNDMNEPAVLGGKEIPTVVEFGTGNNRTTLAAVKNVFGMQMARATFEGTKKDMGGNERPFNLTRASYAGIQKYSAVWTGDNRPEDEHMLLGYRLLNSMGLSGVPFVGMDIAGFSGDASPDLFVRWMSLGVYAPLYRNHTAINNRYHEPWEYGEATTEIMRHVIGQRYALLPYLYSAFYQAHKTGMPVNRMLPIHYTYDSAVYTDKYGTEFEFGDNLLVCPVDSKTMIADVYLPGKGTTWYRFSTDEAYPGGDSQFVGSPLTDLPVFVRAGAIIPEQAVIQDTKEAGDGILYLHVWQGATGSSFDYYEDDGHTYDYEQGKSYRRQIRYDPGARRIVLGKADAGYPTRFSKVRVVLHGATGWDNVQINGKTTRISQDQKLYFVEFNNSNDPITIQW
ncbi:glycoside hydrolase family 31 protein [Dinghuibacter silviterrae]|nr:glycoside hydrolase family 31 protein [Dinghuibacter silviterrae]